MESRNNKVFSSNDFVMKNNFDYNFVNSFSIFDFLLIHYAQKKEDYFDLLDYIIELYIKTKEKYRFFQNFDLNFIKILQKDAFNDFEEEKQNIYEFKNNKDTFSVKYAFQQPHYLFKTFFEEFKYNNKKNDFKELKELIFEMFDYLCLVISLGIYIEIVDYEKLQADLKKKLNEKKELIMDIYKIIFDFFSNLHNHSNLKNYVEDTNKKILKLKEKPVVYDKIFSFQKYINHFTKIFGLNPETNNNEKDDTKTPNLFYDDKGKLSYCICNNNFPLIHDRSLLLYLSKYLQIHKDLIIKNILYKSIKNNLGEKDKLVKFSFKEIAHYLPIEFRNSSLKDIKTNFKITETNDDSNGLITSILNGFDIEKEYQEKLKIKVLNSGIEESKKFLEIISNTGLDICLFIQQDRKKDYLIFEKYGQNDKFYIFLLIRPKDNQNQIKMKCDLLIPELKNYYFDEIQLEKAKKKLRENISDYLENTKTENKNNKNDNNVYNRKNILETLKQLKIFQDNLGNFPLRCLSLIEKKLPKNKKNKHEIFKNANLAEEFLLKMINRILKKNNNGIGIRKDINENTSIVLTDEKRELYNVKEEVKTCICKSQQKFDCALNNTDNILACCLVNTFEKNIDNFLFDIDKGRCLILIDNLFKQNKVENLYINRINDIKNLIQRNIEENAKKQEDKKNIVKNDIKAEDQNLDLTKFRKCPHCGILIEKIDGCSFITCLGVNCNGKKYFCFICGKKLFQTDKAGHYPSGIFSNSCKNKQ